MRRKASRGSALGRAEARAHLSKVGWGCVMP